MEEALKQHASIIAVVLSLTHRLDGSIEQFKAAVQLIDGSRLQINEVYIEGKLQKYAYYRLAPSGDIIQGWDNAPHHPEIMSYPHHLHVDGKVNVSHIRDLEGVFRSIEDVLLP
jgi:hypothetical protein